MHNAITTRPDITQELRGMLMEIQGHKLIQLNKKLSLILQQSNFIQENAEMIVEVWMILEL